MLALGKLFKGPGEALGLPFRRALEKPLAGRLGAAKPPRAKPGSLRGPAGC